MMPVWLAWIRRGQQEEKVASVEALVGSEYSLKTIDETSRLMKLPFLKQMNHGYGHLV